MAEIQNANINGTVTKVGDVVVDGTNKYVAVGESVTVTNDNYAVIDLNNGNIQEANNGIFEVTKTGLNLTTAFSYTLGEGVTATYSGKSYTGDILVGGISTSGVSLAGGAGLTVIEKTSNADVIANNSNLAKTALDDGNKTYIAVVKVTGANTLAPAYKNSKGEWAPISGTNIYVVANAEVEFRCNAATKVEGAKEGSVSTDGYTYFTVAGNDVTVTP